MKTEWLRAAVSCGGCQVTISARALRVGVVRSPFASQPVWLTGGREPWLPGGGDSTRRCMTDSASSMRSATAQPDSRAR